MNTELEIALSREFAPPCLPIGLPLAHLTTRRCLEPILQMGHLEPGPCKVFSKNLLYFSYGGVFYRTAKTQTQTQHATELPVAFVFSPEVLKLISHLFPFDSGAMANNAFGPDWFSRLTPFETRFSVTTGDAYRDARRLVYHLFETNSRYLKGQAGKNGRTKQPPFPLLHEFLHADLSVLGVDHRQRTIEAISEVSVSLGRHLLWIGLPELATSRVLQNIFKWTAPSIPRIHTYIFTKNFNPFSIGAYLEKEAYNDVIKGYANFLI